LVTTFGWSAVYSAPFGLLRRSVVSTVKAADIPDQNGPDCSGVELPGVDDMLRLSRSG